MKKVAQVIFYKIEFIFLAHYTLKVLLTGARKTSHLILLVFLHYPRIHQQPTMQMVLTPLPRRTVLSARGPQSVIYSVVQLTVMLVIIMPPPLIGGPLSDAFV